MATVVKRSNWVVWKDVIFALFIREIRTGFSDKLGLGWAVISPLAFIFILSFIRGRMDGGETHTMPTFVFMVYGMLMIQLFLTMLQSCSSAIKKNKALFAFRQVQPISAIFAAALFETLIKMAVIVLIWCVMYFLNYEIRLDNALLLILNFFVMAILAMSLGLMFAMAQCYISEIGKVQQLLTRPLFFISGVFFSLQDISKEYWHYLDWNPILHGIELSRQAVYSSYGAVGVSYEYYLGFTLVVLTIALSWYFSSWKQAISR
ncbi:ABC transporter permease [Ferrimonas balearica]|uniref:ABC transporter permease n=1 Tax=Ferrimonas balearica TaxID=44012 RepID=UPI001C99B2C5|nr:ABC transporter permease [Ferrimonas balearica]MBY5921266.1 ABC transporter permease [Ferrimonas balearica]MBY5996049.1 ABC transporter permease [Ferrimonas balearica]